MIKNMYYLSLFLVSICLAANDIPVSFDQVDQCADHELAIMRKNKHCCPPCKQGPKGDQGIPGTSFSSNYLFAFRTSVLDGNGDGTFKDVVLSTLELQSGWTTPDGIVYRCPQNGVYFISWSMTTTTTTDLGGNNNNAVGIVTLNGNAETIQGSQMGVRFPNNTPDNDGRNMAKSFLVRLNAGDTIQLRFGTTAITPTDIVLTSIGTAPGLSEPVSAALSAVKISD